MQVGDLWGFIDSTGKMVIEPQFPYAGNLHEGLALVKKDGKFGYTDRSGRMVISPSSIVICWSGFPKGWPKSLSTTSMAISTGPAT